MAVTSARVRLPTPAQFLSCRSSLVHQISFFPAEPTPDLQSSLAFTCFVCQLLRLHSFSSLRSCLGFGGNQRGALHGIKTGLAWPSGLNLPQHRRTTLRLLRLPPLASPLRAKAASRLCPRHGPTESSGSTFRGIHWASLPAHYRTWPPPRNQPWSSHQIHQRILLRSHHLCIHPRPRLLWKTPPSTWENHRANHTPARTAPHAQNFKMVWRFCKIWCSRFARMWTTYVSVWNFWTREGSKFFKCFPLCKALDTLQTRPPMHQRPQRWSWLRFSRCQQRTTQRRSWLRLSRRQQRTTWQATDRLHERRHLHRCQTAWLFLCFVHASTSVLLDISLFSCHKSVLVVLEGQTDLNESVSPRGDYVPVV
jgi:hypothetical protein